MLSRNELMERVLNLVISGIPSILKEDKEILVKRLKVLNLVISGIPSIQRFTSSSTISVEF